jgi:tetratricopeptide (TPR) repeat protein
VKIRYEALLAAKSSGDPNAVLEASKRLSASAFAEVANLRMLVGAYPQAIELYKKAIELEDVPSTRLRLALADLRDGRAEDAFSQSERVTQAEPQDSNAWHIYGKALMLKDDNKAAVAALLKSLQLSDNPNVEYALGQALLKSNEKEKGQKVFEQMLQRYGNRPILHVLFAGAYREAKMMDDAVNEFRAAIKIDPNLPNAQFYLGLTLLEQNHWGQTEDSIAAFREAARQNPTDFSANFYLGVGESQLKMFEDSTRHLKIAAEASPKTASVWLYLGLNAFQQQDFKTAKPYLLKAVELTGADEAQDNYQIRRAYVALGRIEFVEGNKEQSEKYMNKFREMQSKSLANSAEAIAETVDAGGMAAAPAVMPRVRIPEQNVIAEAAPLDPTAHVDASVLANAQLSAADKKQVEAQEIDLRDVLSSALNDRGTAEARQGQYATALEHFHEAERWNAQTPGLMRNIGIAAYKLGDAPETIRALRLATQSDPQDRLAHARLAMTLFATDHHDEAVKHFDVLGDDIYRDPAMTYAYAYSLVRVNQQRKATEVLNRLSQLPLPAELLINVGDLYGVLEDYEHAVASYRRALQQEPSIPRARYKMGAALIRLSRAAEAVPELQSELQLSPLDIDVQYNLAYALMETSQKEQAVALLRRLLSNKPDHPQAQYELGKALLEDGKFDEAIEHLEAAERLDSTSAHIHYQLQIAYRRSGRTADADREAKIYKEIKNRKRDAVTLPMPEHKEQ